MLMQISHNNFDGKDYIQVIQSGCVILELPLVKEQGGNEIILAVNGSIIL